MDFIDRIEEMQRLDRLMASREGGLAVVYGRRRIGKTRLLLEWSARHGGLYTVADQSAARIQRRYFAEAVGARLPGFADVDYRDWRGLLERLAREAAAAKLRGPFIFDELPYLVAVSPELPSVLQRWLDHEAKAARLVVAVAGSSQRMMQGLVLSRAAPLFGRAREIIDLEPIEAPYLHQVFQPDDGIELVQLYTAWGGVPRYWELATDTEGSLRERIERLVLDPMGPLHREPDRLLLEEVPSAMETRPVLDAIGAGAHRVSEIAGRLGRPATSMSRPLDRLIEIGLARRDVPFGESEKKTRRALYKIADPFSRLWFRVVAPHGASWRQARDRCVRGFWIVIGSISPARLGRSSAACGCLISARPPEGCGGRPGAGGGVRNRSGTWSARRSMAGGSCSVRRSGRRRRWQHGTWNVWRGASRAARRLSCRRPIAVPGRFGSCSCPRLRATGRRWTFR